MKFVILLVVMAMALTTADALSCRFGRIACIGTCQVQNCGTGYCRGDTCVCSRCGTGGIVGVSVGKKRRSAPLNPDNID
uniref:ASABF-like antimicrobial protein n=1 Tax=Hippocampus kuda TaxID=103715 RepID=A0PI26_HIPKU|nr:ASABF-like antimicrobial protein [Hippocampus kuda]